ncbi:MAG TPA: family 10 glycosylhydrolase [bacterium]|nr:family 10 glycosylhydrolase [bacterium]
MRPWILLLAACALSLWPATGWASAPPRCAGWCGAPPRLALWMEASANLRALSTREGVAAVMDRARAAGVTTVMPEAKNAWGYVTYRSAFAPLIGTSPVPRSASPSYPAPRTWYPPQFDQLQVIIEEAHRRGLEVHAAVNIFGEGLTAFRVGSLFERPQWAAQHLGPAGAILPSTRVAEIAFANPGLPEVQLYELAIIGEIVRTYDIDGLILDRIRYPDVTADFSADSKAAFEQWLGRPVTAWPDEILRIDGTRQIRGPLFREWIAWRAAVIQRFIRAAERLVHGVKPHVAFTAYVGGWYPAYWNEGTNWGAAETEVNLTWMSPRWRQAAAAGFFDYLMVGLYYPYIARSDAVAAGHAMWMSIEGGALLVEDVVAGQTRPVGSLLLPLYEGAPDQFRIALERTQRLTDGAMLFDLVYLDRYDWWALLPGQNE